MSRARDFADLAGAADAGTVAGTNLIINGDMAVAQRGTSSTSVTDGYYTVDRFSFTPVATDELAVTHSQSTTVPSGQGFANSWKLEVTTAETALAADELCIFRQQIEGQNLQHLAYGTSSAKSLTLSFWVRSSLIGKYSCLFYNLDATRTNLQSFTINTADTWEYKTITIDGDTDSGAGFDNDNGGSLQVAWIFAAGTDWTGTPHTGWGAHTQTDDYAFSDQVNFIAQTGTFYITGVKLEVGSTATPFLHESYGENLAKCQRYYWQNTTNAAYYAYQYVSTYKALPVFFPVPMRATPTADVSYSSGSFTPYQDDEYHFKAYIASSYTDTTGYNTSYVKFNAEL